MKIAFIGGRDIHKLGGIENYMLNLATQLVRLGHEPIVFCESDHSGEEFVNDFRVIYMPGPKSNLLCKPWVGLKATLYCVFKLKDVDIIHYNAWPPSLWSPLARSFGIKSLMQGHGLEWQRSKYSPLQQKIMKVMENITARINRNLIMCSKEQTRYFKSQYDKDAVTIPTAINLPNPTVAASSDIFQRFGIIPKKYFLFLARLVQDKNPNHLIEAFQKAKTDGYQLVIAGNNPSNPEYVSHLHSLAAKDKNIIFTDAVYGNDKIELLQNAYGFCIPSTIEGLSISLLEAMSYKLPIIASKIPANQEVLNDEDALWHTPGHIEELICSLEYAVDRREEFYNSVETNYSKVVNHYTWEKVAQKYLKYLKETLL